MPHKKKSKRKHSKPKLKILRSETQITKLDTEVNQSGLSLNWSHGGSWWLLVMVSFYLPSSICIWFFPPFFSVSFSTVFGWFESVVIGFKVVGCFSCFQWWRSGYGSRWRLGFWVSLLRWVAVAALDRARFVFWWCYCGNAGFVVVVLWRRWVCCGGSVVVCNSNTQQLWTNKTTQKPMGPTESENLPLCHWVMYLRNWKHQFGVFSFHHSHSKYLSWSDENKIRKSSQTKKIMWVSCFFITKLWVSSDITQNWPKPNRL